MTQRAGPSDDHMVRSVEDLLRLTSSESTDDLDLVVYDYPEMDGWIDWDRTTDEEIIICVATTGQFLEFPFTMSTFWATLDELDELAQASLPDA